MNWGKGIAIALTLFIGFIVYLVVIMVSHSVDLETEDYYKKDIAYQDEITSLENANALSDRPTIVVTASHIVVQFSPNRTFQNIELTLNRPNDEKLDKRYKIEGTNTFTVDKNELQKGVYKMELSYEKNGSTYLQKVEHYIK